MKIYIDTDFKCHVHNDGTMRGFDVGFFDNKCEEFVASYRYVPEGESWTRSDGEIFEGEMISTWNGYKIAEAAQSAADRVQAQADEEIATLLDTIEELIIGG